MDEELTNPYLDAPRDPDELKALIREIIAEWPETKGYHVLVGSDPAEFGFPVTSPYDGWSTIFPKKRILYVTGMQYWATPAIIALVSHEIGHIVGEHAAGEGDDELQNHWDEYYADEFAFDNVENYYGFVPKTAGLWLLRGYVDWFWNIDSLTHPSNQHRWDRLALNGYVPKDYYQELRAMSLETEGDRYASLIGDHRSEPSC